jgi:hypothetical protein
LKTEAAYIRLLLDELVLAQLLTFEEASDAKGDRQPKPRTYPRDWMMMLLGRVGSPSSIALRRECGESKPEPLWKQFDDTHHWDSIAEEWIPNDLT